MLGVPGRVCECVCGYVWGGVHVFGCVMWKPDADMGDSFHSFPTLLPEAESFDEPGAHHFGENG